MTGDGYQSKATAEYAGNTALARFLETLAIEEKQRR